MFGIKDLLIGAAVNYKLRKYRSGGGCESPWLDMLIFNKVKAILGGNVKIMMTGSAAIAVEVLEFLKISFCVPIIEGYGLTESGGGISSTFEHDVDTGHVGGLSKNCKLRLKDIPEMNYYHT
jgi:long-chain acyl-CoA synthetase